MNKNEITETIIWIYGIAMFTAGCGIQWGWPAAMIASGAIFTFWPLVKQFKKT
jgi:hypothetical protein